MQLSIVMVRTVLMAGIVAAAPAWAVGERIKLPNSGAYADQLRETLCISMECGEAVDAELRAREVNGKVEIKVLTPAGGLKATVFAPLNGAGRISSMDLVAATSALIAAIEGPEPSKATSARPEKPAKKKTALAAAKGKKKHGVKLAAKGRGPHSRG